MTETPTRDEFKMALRKISCGYVGMVTADTEEELDRDRAKYLAGRKVTLAAYDAQVKRVAELKQDDAAEADEFNAGFTAYENGEPVEAEPDSTPCDQWRTGWAWAAFEPMRKRVAELEAEKGIETAEQYAVRQSDALERNTLAEHVAELEAMLKRLEWTAHDCDTCPECYALENNGHRDNCALAALFPKEAHDDQDTDN